ncbi:MAG: sensor histidine kinase [Spirosomataceae bacterium]
METSKSVKFATHVILWICYTFLPVIYTIQKISSDPGFASQSTFNNPYFWAFVSASSVSLFYINSEILIPNYFKKKKNLHYFGILSVVIGLFIIVRVIMRINITGSSSLTYYFYFNALLPYLLIFSLSTSYRFFTDYQKEQELIRSKENERLRSELSFLRSQISPHFMFNLMNSMVSLARKKSDILEPSLIKMSELLRYMLYEKDDSKIAVEKEIQYLDNYIALQQLRFGKKIAIQFDHSTCQDNHLIEPMLLIPFVENAFKHGTGLVKAPFIEIVISSQPCCLYFKVINKVSTETTDSKDTSSGIGLANVRRRLDLLYPNAHTLDTRIENDLYISELHLNFENK